MAHLCEDNTAYIWLGISIWVSLERYPWQSISRWISLASYGWVSLAKDL